MFVKSHMATAASEDTEQANPKQQQRLTSKGERNER